MELYIFNNNFVLQGVCDNFTSLVWPRRFHEPGSLELHVPYTVDNLKNLVTENVIYKGKGEAAVIEGREVREEGGKCEIAVFGRTLESYLERRIMMGTLNFFGTAENYMYGIVRENCLVAGDRLIPNLELSLAQNLTELLTKQTTYANLLESLQEASVTSGLGFKIEYKPSVSKMVYSVYKGTDRSTAQTVNPVCLFCKEYDNLLEYTYTEETADYKNTAIVCGANDVKLDVPAGEVTSGLNRREIYVDATSTDNKKETGEVMTAEEYNAVLSQMAREEFNNSIAIKTFEGKVNTVDGYRTDYDLGDIVTVQDKNIGVTINTRIIECEEVYEGSMMTVNLIFGDKVPTLLDKIKRR